VPLPSGLAHFQKVSKIHQKSTFSKEKCKNLLGNRKIRLGKRQTSRVPRGKILLLGQIFRLKNIDFRSIFRVENIAFGSIFRLENIDFRSIFRIENIDFYVVPPYG
jgi:hypothetical protein